MSNGHYAVLGAGAWGTTFAQVLADSGHRVKMWARNPQVVEMINQHDNSKYLPGIILPDAISAQPTIEQAVDGAHTVVLAVPTGVVGEVVEEAAKVAPDATYVSLAKGVEIGSDRLVTQVMQARGGLDPSQIAVVSGPNLSKEIAVRQPAATVVASTDFQTAKEVAKACHSGYFRPYVSTDVVGVQIGGAAKNVIAIAIGAAEGMGYGTNTRSTLITRGLAEITRLGEAMGADPQTFAGLAGVGDLIATCSSRLSRNYSLGFRMGEGMSLEEALALSAGVAEGARTAEPILNMANKLDVDMPITRGVVEVLEGRANVQQMGEMLLGRPQKMDGWQITLLD